MMNKAASLENQFNDAAPGGGDASGGRAPRFKKLRDIEYAEVVTELTTLQQATEPFDVERKNDLQKLLNKMESCMKPIDEHPDSFDAILTFGNAPLKSLESVTQGMVTVQGRFAEQVNVMAGALDGVEGKMNSLKQFGSDIGGALKRLGKVGGKGLGGLGKILAKISKTEKQLTEDEKFVADMQKSLPLKVKEMYKLKDDMAATERGLAQVMTEAEKLGVVRVETTLELGVYVNTAKEVLRRYDEEYIPQAKADYEQTQHPDDAALLEKLSERRDDFAQRMLTLKGSQVQGQIAAEQLRRMIQTMRDQRKKIEDIRVNGVPEWIALIMEAGIAGSSLKIAQAIEKSDKSADELFDLVTNMIEKSDEMTRNAKARGTIDPEKLIEASNKMRAMLDKDVDDRKKRLEAVEETYKKLTVAHNNMLEASDTSRQTRLLEADKAGNDPKPVDGTQTPAVNDNGVVDTPKENTRSTRRNRDSSGPK